MSKTTEEGRAGDSRSAKKDWLLLCGIQVLYWSTMTLHSSFLIFYLNQCHYDTTVIATITLMMTVINLFAQPVWGYLADAFIGIKNALLICLMGSIPALVFLPLLVRYVWLMVAVNMIYALFNYPLQGLTDSVTNIAATNNRFVVYGFTRGCGSVGAALSSLLIGFVLDYTKTEVLFWIEAGALFLAFLLMARYQGVSYGIWRDPEEEPAASGGGPLMQSIGQLLRSPAYVIMLLSVTLMNAGNRTTLFFVPILIEEFGGNNVHLGFSLFLNCILMAPCMVIQSYMIRKRVKNYVPLLLGASVGILRACLLYFAHTLPVLIGLQILQSFAYGFLQPATVTAAGEASPLEIRATAISLAIAVTTVFSTFLGQIGGSMLSDVIGIHRTFVVSAAVTFLGILCYLPVVQMERKRGGKNGNVSA